MANILRVQLDTETYEITPMPDKYRNLGGRGLTSRIISQEVPPTCDPLGKENKLIFAAGILAGTSMPNSGRLSVGAKSPLTGGVKESNAGGAAAHMLARLGIQAIVLEGCAAEWTGLKVDGNGLAFLSSAEIKEQGIRASIEWSRKMYGDTISVIAIGQAGEMELLAAGIAVTSPDYFPRMAARGGLGAVMGAKK